jgi:alkylhydroperoxidase family enzyme
VARLEGSGDGQVAFHGSCKNAYYRTMARLTFPDRGMGEHVDWALLRPEMAVGMGQLSSAVYEHSQLTVRERESARWIIALINDCAVCRDTREGEAAGANTSFYGEVANWRTSDSLSRRERLAAEFAERFCLDHQAMDNEFWERLHKAFADDELADLVICCGMFLGLGRVMAVVGVRAPEERILI